MQEKNRVEENHKKHLERIAFYRGFGYDLEKERDFILDSSLPPVPGDILEIGTGKGHFALALAKRGFSFVSIDLSAEEQEFAKLNIRYLGLERQVVFRVEDAERLSFPGRSFDTIFSVNVFHHLERPQLVLSEMIRLLRPGGKIVLSDFNDRGLEIINACHTREGRNHDHFKCRLDEARRRLAQEGFDITECESTSQRVLVAASPAGKG